MHPYFILCLFRTIFGSAKNVDVGPDPVHINKSYQNFILLVANNNISADAMCVRPGIFTCGDVRGQVILTITQHKLVLKWLCKVPYNKTFDKVTHQHLVVWLQT